MRFLLLQIRDHDDPMRAHEVEAFARAVHCPTDVISVLNLLDEPITPSRLDSIDVVFVGGAGGYSVCDSQPWLLRALDGLRLLYDLRQPVFASCWGFQAIARALGGEVVHAPEHAEVGTHLLRLTEAGKQDPLFGELPESFWAQMGHEDRVETLPPKAIRLASSVLTQNQAYTFADWPVYATQFHPELTADDVTRRVRQYPDYLKLTTGLTLDEFQQRTFDSPESAALIRRFLDLLADGSLDERHNCEGELPAS